MQRGTWASIILVIAFFSLPVTASYIARQYERKYEMLNNTVAIASYKSPEQFIEKPTTEQQQIMAYIDEIFAEDADKAYQILGCENAALNPDAVNTAGNSPAGSRDIGVFQINEYWQKTQGKFLFNWKINVEIAHQLYEENGKSFKLWTCGRKLNI